MKGAGVTELEIPGEPEHDWETNTGSCRAAQWAFIPTAGGRDEPPHPTQSPGAQLLSYTRGSWMGEQSSSPGAEAPPHLVRSHSRCRPRQSTADPSPAPAGLPKHRDRNGHSPLHPCSRAPLPRKGFNYNHVPRKCHGAARLRRSPTTNPCSGDFSPGQKSPKTQSKAPPPPNISISRYLPRSTPALHGAGAEPWGAAPPDATEPKVGLCSSPVPSRADPKRSPNLIREAQGVGIHRTAVKWEQGWVIPTPPSPPTFQGIQLSKHFPALPSPSTAAACWKRPQSIQATGCLQPARKGVPKTEHCTGAVTVQGKHHFGSDGSRLNAGSQPAVGTTSGPAAKVTLQPPPSSSHSTAPQRALQTR